MTKRLQKKIEKLDKEQLKALEQKVDKMLEGETEREVPPTYLNVNDNKKYANFNTPIRTIFNALRLSAKENGGKWNSEEGRWEFNKKKGYNAFKEKAESYDNVILGTI